MSDAVDFDEKTFQRYLKVIHNYTGITISPNRRTMLQGRIRPRMRELNLPDYQSYIEYLETHPEEKQNFIDQITTNETYFYRTPRIWQYVESYVVKWYAEKLGTTFYVWSAAASSGAEAYTLASILQAFKDKHPDFNYQIFGTDINKEILDVANEGIYSGRTIESFQKTRPDLFDKVLRESAEECFTVVPEIRTKVKFTLHNLMEKPKFNLQFDLVLIRNVLIYFKPPEQEVILGHVATTMKPHASLLIGESESLNSLQTSFKYLSPLIYEIGKKSAA